MSIEPKEWSQCGLSLGYVGRIVVFLFDGRPLISQFNSTMLHVWNIYQELYHPKWPKWSHWMSNSLLSSGWGDMQVNRRFLLAALRVEVSLGVKSLDRIYRVIAWSLNVPGPKIDFLLRLGFEPSKSSRNMFLFRCHDTPRLPMQGFFHHMIGKAMSSHSPGEL